MESPIIFFLQYLSIEGRAVDDMLPLAVRVVDTVHKIRGAAIFIRFAGPVFDITRA